MTAEGPNPFDTPEMRALDAQIQAGQDKSVTDSVAFMRSNQAPIVFGPRNAFSSPAAKEIKKLMEPQNHSGMGSALVMGRIVEEAKNLGYVVSTEKGADGSTITTLTPPQQ